LVESAIFFLAGFLSAALLALLAAPAVTQRARRLAVARARLLAPLSEAQARADRDALRGQHAIETLRLERRIAAAETERAIRMADLGRHASRIVALEDVTAERAAEIARQREELAGQAAEIRDLSVQTAAQNVALRDLESQRDDSDLELAVARSRMADLESLGDENRVVIAGLETRAAGLQLQLADFRRAAIAAESERVRLSAALAERMDAADRLAVEMEVAIRRSRGFAAESEALTAEATDLRARLLELEARLYASEAAREDMAFESSRRLLELADRDATIVRLETENRELGLRLTGLANAARAQQDALALENQKLLTAHSTMEGALRAARSDRAGLQDEIESLRARLAESAAMAQLVFKGDHALRQSIARLGREISRGVATEDDPPFVAQVASFARREPAAAHGPEGAANPARHDQPIASEG
jgi:hypothetical protein